MEGMSLLKMIHNEFEDLQIYRAEAKPFLSQSIIKFSLHSNPCFWISFSLFCYFSLCVDQMGSVPHFFPPVCVWPRSHDLEHQQASNLWKYFCCWWLLSGKKKRTRDIEPCNTGNWVTTSRKEGAHGCRKHLGAVLAYLFSKQQRVNLSSGTKGPEWTGRCQECNRASEEIHPFIHSFISKSLSSGI